MKTSEQINELAAALAKAQGEFPDIPKDKTAKLKGTTRDGKPYDYSYNYADLSTIVKATRPALSKHGLSVIQVVTEGQHGGVVVSRLMHSSGQFIESSFPFQISQKMQNTGSQITYVRRYTLSAMLGIATEDDDDANLADGKESVIQNKVPARSAALPKGGQVSSSVPEKKGQGAVATPIVPPSSLSQAPLPDASPKSNAPTDELIERFQGFTAKHGWKNSQVIDLIRQMYNKAGPRTCSVEQLDQVADIVAVKTPAQALNIPIKPEFPREAAHDEELEDRMSQDPLYDPNFDQGRLNEAPR